jgi:hypothetical protein
VFGKRSEEVIRDFKKLHSEELCNIYSFLNTSRQIRSRRMMWAGHVERMGGESSISNHSEYKFLLVYSIIRV